MAKFQLEGEKVILKKHQLKDAESYLKWLRDKEINQYLIQDGSGMSIEDEKKWIRSTWRAKDKKAFAILTKEGHTIGSIGLENISQKNRSASFGLFIGDRKYQNKGHGTDAVKTMLRYGFVELGLNRIELGVFEKNKRAKKVYEKCGFVTEGFRRNTVYYKNQFINDYLMSILKNDWEKIYGKKR